MNSMLLNPEVTADIVIDLYKKYGNADYIGEPVSQLEHMCQCAKIAEEEGYDEEVILAALFHDIGHFCEHFMEVEQMASYGVVDHEKLGADFLRNLGFSSTITSLVKNHVEAKRYLTYHYPDYYEGLSDASKQTLQFQGGVMTSEEARTFELDPNFDMHIRLRKWDERAKLSNEQIAPMEKYRVMIIKHLEKQVAHAN